VATVLPIIAAAVAAVVVGRLGWGVLLAAAGADAPPRGRRGASPAPALLTAFALVSAVLFALADLGALARASLAGSLVAAGAASALVAWRRGALRAALASLPSDLAAAAALAGLAVVIAAVLPPIDTTLAGSDSSVFLAASRELAARGRLVHEDELVAEMTLGERDRLFRNRFAGDNTGPHARFPGGVMLVSTEHALVGFYFYHLFPAWLAGARLLAGESFLGTMALFAAVSLASLWRAGRRPLGAAGATAACALLACFHPQAYFTRFPLSELLAQALFLGGLCALALGLEREGRERLAHVVLGSLLWGALCLCRVDSLPLLWLGLATASLLPARSGLRARDWAVPLVVTGAFGALALFHQLSHGVDYVGAIGNRELASSLVVAAARWPWLRGAALAALVLGGGAAVRVVAADRAGRLARGAVKGVALAVATATVASFLARLEPARVVRHVGWVASYATPLVLALLAAGAACALASSFRSRGGPALALAAALFAGPALCYAVDPMVVPVQPWAVRRLLPIVFPLLFLLAVRGWKEAAERAIGRRAGAATGLLALAACAGFLRSSAALAGAAGPPSLAAVHALVASLPPDALVLLPDDSADLHLGPALVYAGGRRALLVPVAPGAAADVEEAAAAWLERQRRQGRRVCLLLARPGELAGWLAARFDLRLIARRTVTFEGVRFVAQGAFPPPPLAVTLDARVLEVAPAKAPVAREVTIGEPADDLPVLVEGFHGPETEARPGQPPRAFRWTAGRAVLALPPGTAAVELAVDTTRPAGAPSPEAEIEVDGARVPVLLPRGEGLLRLALPAAHGAARRRLTIRVNAFRPAALGLSGDGRALGLRVFSLRPVPAEAAAPSLGPGRASGPPRPGSAASAAGAG
jgi:hypothetical protein